MAPCICSVDLVWPITFIVFVESALQGCTLNHRIFTLLLNFIAAHFKSHSMRPMASHKKILNSHNFLLFFLEKSSYVGSAILQFTSFPVSAFVALEEWCTLWPFVLKSNCINSLNLKGSIWTNVETRTIVVTCAIASYSQHQLRQ